MMLSIDTTLLGPPCHKLENEKYKISVWGWFFRDESLQFLKKCYCESDLREFYHQNAGLFFVIIKGENSLIAFNDFFSNYRIYYKKKENIVSFSRNASHFSGNHSIESKEDILFNKKNYTIANKSRLNDIKKLSPISYLRITDHINFVPVISKFKKQYTKSTFTLNKLDGNIRTIKDKKNILFFSGGIDSLYIALRLKHLNIHFDCLFIEYDEFESDNQYDKIRTQALCAKLNLKLHIFKYKISEHSAKYAEIARNENIDDYGFSASYACAEWIKNYLGEVNIIHGQSSDSVFTWGVSGKGFSSIIQRSLLTDTFFNMRKYFRIILTLPLNIIYSLRHKKIIKISVECKDIINSLYCPLGYLIAQIKDHKLRKHIDDFHSLYDCENYNDHKLLAKLNYLQGPSNIFPINSALAFGHDLSLPYLDPEFIHWGIYQQSNFSFVFFPRELIRSKIPIELLEIVEQKNTFKGGDQSVFNRLVSVEKNLWHDK